MMSTLIGYLFFRHFGKFRVREELRAMGWNTMVIWECQLKPKERQATLENVVRLLDSGLVSRSTTLPGYGEDEIQGNPRAHARNSRSRR